MQNEVLNSLQEKVDESTHQFIKMFEKSATDVRTIIDREFSQKPWLYFTSCVGAGVVVGYFIGRSNSRFKF